MSEFVGHRQLGEFMPRQRRQIRSPKNPLDRATIVSIYPKNIKDEKVTLFPGKFFIAKGSFESPSLTVIEPSVWWRDIDAEQPLIEISVAATVMAESIINDYCNGFLAVDMETMRPGLFYVPGELSRTDLKVKYTKKLEEIRAKQNAWFQKLVQLADSLWARTNHNPLAIWDEMRLAARELGLDKEWLRDSRSYEMVKCFACGNLRNPAYPICPTCRIIDPNHPLADSLKFANG